MSSKLCVIVVILSVAVTSAGKSKKMLPPHCTHLTKDTDYVPRFKYDYPMMYIPQGQHEAYQKLFCLNPAEINKGMTTVCDWAAPPQVQYTLGDEYLHIVRVDPTGRFYGAAIITTLQVCSHNISSMDIPDDLKTSVPSVIQIR